MPTRLALAALLVCPAVRAEGPPRDRQADAARTVVAAVVRAAEENARAPRAGRLDGDALTARYVRAAAAAALRLPEKEAVPAFLVGAGVTLDDSDLLRKNPLTAAVWRRVEGDADRARRLRVLGKPTVHGRHDFCQHFAVSAALTALAGPEAAEAAGVLKELLDAEGSSGFSFADLAADYAGVALARRLTADPRRLAAVAESFEVADYAARPTGLPDGLPKAQFVREYGSVADARFKKLEAEVRRRVRALPAYRDDRP